MRECVCVFEWKTECKSAFVMKKEGKGILFKWLIGSVCLQDIVWNFHFLVGAEELKGSLLPFCWVSQGCSCLVTSGRWKWVPSRLPCLPALTSGCICSALGLHLQCQLPSTHTSGQAVEGEVGEHRKESISFNPACFQFLNFSVKSRELWPQDTHSCLSQ